MAQKKADPSQIDYARTLRESGVTWREISARTGLSIPTLYKYVGSTPRAPRVEAEQATTGDSSLSSPVVAPPPERKPDPPPNANAPHTETFAKPPRVKKGKATDDELETFLRGGLKLCAVPMRMKCDFCADHMTNKAAAAAAEALKDSDVRDIVERVWREWERYAGFAVLAGWIGVPVAHHLAPAPMYRLVAPVMGLPPKHAHAPAQAPTAPAQQPTAPLAPEPPAPAPVVDVPTQFEGLDLDQLMQMAQGLGINFDPAVLAALQGGGNGTQAVPTPAEAENVTRTADAAIRNPAGARADTTEIDSAAAAATLPD